VLAGLLALLGAGCGAGLPQQLPEVTLSENELETYARRHLLDARALIEEGRLESAARVAARGLELRPDNAELQRLRAEVLERLGRSGEARAHWKLANLLDPPPPPPPETPLDLPSEGVLVALLTPPQDSSLGKRVPRDWPRGEVAATLEQRLRTRLPQASIQNLDPQSVSQVRSWIEERQPRGVLSLRVDRAFCGRSLKDGFFAVAWIRAAAGAAGAGQEGFATSEEIRSVVSRPIEEESCRREAVARALEEVLERPALREALLREPRPNSSWGSPVLRTLFPQLGRRVAEEIDEGRRLLSSGQLSAALAHFRAAAAIDPDDLDARSFLEDAEASLSLSEQITHVSLKHGIGEDGTPHPTVADPGVLAPLFSPEQRRRLDLQLLQERRIREELQATLAVLDEDLKAPVSEALATLRPSEIPDPEATGPRLARTRCKGRLASRVLYAPDGEVLVRYYFDDHASTPILREEDGDGDGRPDRWVAYAGLARHEVWEDRLGTGSPDLHLIFAEGGDPLESLEIDADGDGSPERVFRYQDGRLLAEDRDTDGDGRADLFDRFDGSGSLALREEDLDGDGQVDLRTAYRSGRIVRREIVNPDAVGEIR
jgi:Flp pilus assembly protein TadD